MQSTILSIFITLISNIAMVPAVLVLHRQRKGFEACIGGFTALVSFLYHISESVGTKFWLSEGQWHRLDNVGGILSFIVWIIYLMDIKSDYTRNICMYTALGAVLILQEKSPWDLRFTVYPILFYAVILLFKCSIAGTWPKYNSSNLKRGMAYLLLGFACFIFGLDDKNDPCRFFHGCWHLFVGIAAYYNWQLFPDQVDYTILPTNRMHQI